MKIFLTILFFTIFSANATVYYVSNAGSDAANGITTGTSWQTIAKVNSSTFAAGDQILFKAGDTWNEKLIPPSSGASGNVITFGSYSTGANPIITGLQSASGWVDSIGNIWMANIPNSVAYQNTILINGRIAAKARYPNYSYLGGLVQAFDRVTLQNTIPFNTTGAELVLSNFVWIWDVNKIASQSGNTGGDTLRLQTSLTYNTNWVITPRIFIQNSFACLDTLNEWYIDSTRKKLFVESNGAPTNVQFSSIDTLISCHLKSYLTFQNINFQGGNMITFSADSGSYVTLKNCNINYSGKNGLGLNKSVKTTIQNTIINNSLNNGIYMRQSSDSTLMDTDTIKNSGTLVGMGMSGNAAYEGIFAYGNVIKFQNSRIDSCGYNGYTWYGGLKDTVYHNYITNFNLNKADGGGIYTDGSNAAAPQTGSLVRGNIVGNGLGTSGFGVAAIYLDNQSSGVQVDSNTIFHSFINGLTFNGGVNITARNNTVFNDIGGAFNFANATSFTGTIKGNIFYSSTATYPTNYFGSTVPNGSIFEDSNYVLRTLSPTTLFQYGQSLAYYSLAAWQTFSGQDAHTSITFPSSASQVGILYYNATFSPVVTALSGQYVDVYGVVYNNSITLQPFQSAILFYSPLQLLKSYGNLIFQ